MFDFFWSSGNLQCQRLFIGNHIQRTKPEYRRVRTNGDDPRKPNLAYFLDKNDERIRVCKIFFSNTLNVTYKMMQTVIEQKEYIGDDETPNHLNTRGRHISGNKSPEDVLNDIREHIQSIPRIESHYCRASTTREYVDGSRSLTSIYEDYKSNMVERRRPFGQLPVFRMIFNTEFNISFHIPKKDQCDLCTRYYN